MPIFHPSNSGSSEFFGEFNCTPLMQPMRKLSSDGLGQYLGSTGLMDMSDMDNSYTRILSSAAADVPPLSSAPASLMHIRHFDDAFHSFPGSESVTSTAAGSASSPASVTEDGMDAMSCLAEEFTDRLVEPMSHDTAFFTGPPFDGCSDVYARGVPRFTSTAVSAQPAGGYEELPAMPPNPVYYGMSGQNGQPAWLSAAHTEVPSIGNLPPAHSRASALGSKRGRSLRDVEMRQQSSAETEWTSAPSSSSSSSLASGMYDDGWSSAQQQPASMYSRMPATQDVLQQQQPQHRMLPLATTQKRFKNEASDGMPGRKTALVSSGGQSARAGAVAPLASRGVPSSSSSSERKMASAPVSLSATASTAGASKYMTSYDVPHSSIPTAEDAISREDKIRMAIHELILNEKLPNDERVSLSAVAKVHGLTVGALQAKWQLCCPSSQRNKRYSEEQLRKAMDVLIVQKSGFDADGNPVSKRSLLSVANEFGIPEATLRWKLKAISKPEHQ